MTTELGSEYKLVDLIEALVAARITYERLRNPEATRTLNRARTDLAEALEHRLTR